MEGKKERDIENPERHGAVQRIAYRFSEIINRPR